MGYTHYWTFKTTKVKKSDYQAACIGITKMLKVYQKTVADHERLSGYSAHAKTGQYGGVFFNGKKDLGHEDFVLRDTIAENESFNFCKTAQKPYDTAVVAALILLHHYLGDSVEIGSDGDASDWLDGLRLAKSICPSAKIPKSICGVPLKALGVS